MLARSTAQSLGAPARAELCQPFRVTARLRGPLAGNAPIALDALLAFAVWQRSGVEPATLPSELMPIEIPIARSECGRVHLCSHAICEPEEREHRYVNRRFPVPEAQALAVPSFSRILIAGGPCKSYRIPLETRHVRDDVVTWYAVGELDETIGLLRECIGYLGKRRAVGLGRVESWDAEPVASGELWDGFPVLRDGYPLRPLPSDWPGVSDDADRGMACVTYPYWVRTREELAAIPRWSP